jgi:heme a synthase
MKSFTFIMTVLALSVIILGAYTRLSNAGLGCPDWPGCYGKIAVPSNASIIADVENQFQQTVEPHKAWIEMIHRYAAASLGLCVLIFCLIKLRHGLTLPLALLTLVITQALLGMWTVTLKLQPLIVSLHLIGGMSIAAILWWQHLKTKPSPSRNNFSSSAVRIFAFSLTGVLILQLMLGGLTSSHYAALICPDFPYCQGRLLPAFDFGGLLHWDNHPLSPQQLITLHMLHRIGALFVAVLSFFLGAMLLRQRAWRQLGFVLLLLVCTQITLGILNIVWLLPIKIAVLHNGTAMLLLLTLLTCDFYLLKTHREQHHGK